MSNESAQAQLSPEQQRCYLSFVETSMQVSSKADFVALIHEHVKPVLPHGMCIAGVGRILPDFRIQPYQLLPINYPVDYLKAVQKVSGGIQSPIMTRWAKTRLPQLYEPLADTGADITQEWLDVYQGFQLGNQLAHGVHDLFSDVTSYFSFCAVPVSPTPWHAYLLRLLVPHLHMALLQALTREREAKAEEQSAVQSLTPRERELLALLLSGKSNVEIAQVLHRSEKTIKNQLHALYGKLEVNTRTQAVRRVDELRGKQFWVPLHGHGR